MPEACAAEVVAPLPHMPRSTSAPLWAITSYFNPLGWQRRRDNYRVFRHHLTQVPLATIEWSPDGRFELGAGDADLLIQVSGGDLMWQKERLLNLLAPQLPAACRAVAWLDADVIFERNDWAEVALQMLRQQVLVHLFSHAHNMGPIPLGQWFDKGALADATLAAEPDSPLALQWPVAARRTGQVAAISATAEPYAWTATKTSDALNGPDPTPGFAWAASREWLRTFEHLDGFVIGGGDGAYALAALGAASHVAARHQLSPSWREAYLNVAQCMAEAARGRVGFVPGVLRALWHGELPRRRYRARYQLLADHGFDPRRDLVRAGSGVWSWSDAGRALSAGVRAYMLDRREDG